MKPKKVILAVIPYKGKILAVSRKTNKTRFGLVGGKLEKGTYLDNLYREIYEETGLIREDFSQEFKIMKSIDDNGYECHTFLVLPNNSELVRNKLEKFQQLTPKENEGDIILLSPEELSHDAKSICANFNKELFKHLGYL